MKIMELTAEIIKSRELMTSEGTLPEVIKAVSQALADEYAVVVKKIKAAS